MRIAKTICFILALCNGFRSYGQDTMQPIHFDKVTTIAPGATYTLQNIYFEPDSHKLKPGSTEEMNRLASVLQENPKLKIRIEGHVCCVAKVSDAFDIDTQEPKLSENRAKEVYDYLIKKGIDRSRLSYAGLGKSRPVIADERTNEDAAKNRRVEFKVLVD